MEELEAGSAAEDSWSRKPTEEERLAWEEQQQQREKLSNRMGQYLLKGYRMLGTNCGDCGNILLRTRDGVDFCVHCIEIEEKAPKDSEPAHNDSTSTVPKPAERSQDVGTAMQQSGQHHHDSAKALQQSSCGSLGPYPPRVLQQSITCSQEALVSKLQWATRELASTSSVDQSIQLCQLIKVCAEALKTTRELLPPNTPT